MAGSAEVYLDRGGRANGPATRGARLALERSDALALAAAMRVSRWAPRLVPIATKHVNVADMHAATITACSGGGTPEDYASPDYLAL